MANSFAGAQRNRVHAATEVPPSPLLYLQFSTDKLSKIAQSSPDQFSPFRSKHPAQPSPREAAHAERLAVMPFAATLCSCTVAAHNSKHQNHFHPSTFQVKKHSFPCVPVRPAGNQAPRASISTRSACRTAGAAVGATEGDGGEHPLHQSQREAVGPTAGGLEGRS